jgi:hypothetical protein
MERISAAVIDGGCGGAGCEELFGGVSVVFVLFVEVAVINIGKDGIPCP